MKRSRDSNLEDGCPLKLVKVDNFKVPSVPPQRKISSKKIDQSLKSGSHFLHSDLSLILRPGRNTKTSNLLSSIKRLGRSPFSMISCLENYYTSSNISDWYRQIQNNPKPEEIRIKLKDKINDMDRKYKVLIGNSNNKNTRPDVVIAMDSGKLVYEGKVSTLGYYGSVPTNEIKNLKVANKVPSFSDFEKALNDSNNRPTQEDISELNETISSLNHLVQNENDQVDLNQSYPSITSVCSEIDSGITEESTNDMSILNYSLTKATMNIALANVQAQSDKVMRCQDKFAECTAQLGQSQSTNNKENNLLIPECIGTRQHQYLHSSKYIGNVVVEPLTQSYSENTLVKNYSIDFEVRKKVRRSII